MRMFEPLQSSAHANHHKSEVCMQFSSILHMVSYQFGCFSQYLHYVFLVFLLLKQVKRNHVVACFRFKAKARFKVPTVPVALIQVLFRRC